MAPWKIAPSNAELDVEHDCGFFSSQASPDSSHIFWTFHLPVQKILPSKRQREQDIERETYVQHFATEGRLSLIQGEQHFVKGLHVVCHGTVTPQCSEVPDCGLLMSSGLLNESCPAISDAPEQKLEAWLELGSKDCPLTVHCMELDELVP